MLDSLISVCCACGESKTTRNIILHNVRGATPGQGWGCFVCDLPSDGAASVVCDECLDAGRKILMICVGYPANNERLLLADFNAPHDHNFAIHAAIDSGHRWN